MPRFNYIAIDRSKSTEKGSVTAESAYAARKHLRAKGLHPTSIKEVKLDQHTKSLIKVFKRSNKTQVAEFTKQLATMLGAGIKLTEALSVLVKQITDTGLKNAITDIRDRVVTGESFTDALTEYERYFDVIYVSMIRVGEVTGTLPDSLKTIATFIEKRQKVESKIVTAMIYPAILMLCCIAVVIFLTITVIPRVGEQIQKAGGELPWITSTLMKTAEILTSYWVVLVIAILVLIVISTKRFLKTPKGAYLKDKLMLSLPIFGPLIKQRIVSRFSSTLSTLLGAGLSIAESLKVVAEVTGNTLMNSAVKKARERILSGADIATPLRDSGVIDPAIAHMVAVGEKSGELETMLKSISDNLESSSDIVIERLSAALEPVIIIFMAALVGIIAFAALLPILQYSSGQF
jgi:type II secretory pathway component PulF